MIFGNPKIQSNVLNVKYIFRRIKDVAISLVDTANINFVGYALENTNQESIPLGTSVLVLSK
jgi:hypothetical protein